MSWQALSHDTLKSNICLVFEQLFHFLDNVGPKTRGWTQRGKLKKNSQRIFISILKRKRTLNFLRTRIPSPIGNPRRILNVSKSKCQQNQSKTVYRMKKTQKSASKIQNFSGNMLFHVLWQQKSENAKKSLGPLLQSVAEFYLFSRGHIFCVNCI